jgi:hypothetical protein
VSVVTVLPLPAAALIARMLASPARQCDQLCADGLGDGFQLALAKVSLEKFHIRGVDANYGETGSSGPFAHITALAHKDLGHDLDSFPCSVSGIYPKPIYMPSADLSR